ncbi:serine/threonine-protein kinase [Sphaerisporangium sp. B11E5]|uniref:serine/threonine-protein kinase n=1 Tax=Sphaerisporangium sp. B11E5 TaxID=3153563 RepID=UPI00325DE284
MTPSPRTLLGRYRLVAPLGRGGMGTVWRATDELLRQDVAIKEVRLPPDLDEAARAELRERTLREARAAARLRAHPSIVTVHDVVADDGRPWIVMELVQGQSLHQVVRAHGPLPPHEVARIGLSLLDALTAAHGAGILHRDVKPANVLLTGAGRVVLTDFGIASLAGDVALTQNGAVAGSPGYISPERLRGDDDRPESDLWSLGATLYTAVEGRSPYAREQPAAMFAAVLLHDPDPMRLAGPLTPVVTGLLVKDPARRMPAAEAAWHLRALLPPDARTPLPGPAAPGRAPAPQPPFQGPAAPGHRPAPQPSSPGGRGTTPPPGGPGTSAPSHPTGPTAPPPHAAGTGPVRPARKNKAPVVVGTVLAALLVTATGVTVWQIRQRELPTRPQAQPTATRTTTATATATTTKAAASGLFAQEPRACSLLTDRQAALLLAGTAKRQFMTRGSCMWQRTDGSFFSIQLARFNDTGIAKLAFTQMRTTTEEEPERYPGTYLRNGPDVGDEAISYTRREPEIGVHRTSILFRKDNLTVTVYFTLRAPGFTRADQAATLIERALENFR